MSQKIQQEQEKLFNRDPWKVKAAKSFPGIGPAVWRPGSRLLVVE